MRKNWLSVLLIGGMLAWGFSWVAPASADGGDEGLGERVAGTYVDEGEFTGFGAPAECPRDGFGASFTGTQTLTAHGTQVATNNLFGGGDAPDAGGGGNLQSPGHGNWTKTGKRQITLTSLIFIQGYTPDADMCKIGCPAAGQIVARPTVVVDFAPDYKTATATIQTDLFFDLRGDADMDGVLDYLDSDGAPGFTIYGCAQWTKLPIQGAADVDDDDD